MTSHVFKSLIFSLYDHVCKVLDCCSTNKALPSNILFRVQTRVLKSQLVCDSHTTTHTIILKNQSMLQNLLFGNVAYKKKQANVTK